MAVSAHADPVHAALCRAAGMDDVLIKPLQLADLQRVLLRFAVARAGDVAIVDDDNAVNATEDAACDPICAVMRQTNAEDGAGLQRALAQRDAATLAYLAHRVHGAALVVGAGALARVVFDLETLARSQPSEWPALGDAVAAVLAAMDDYAGKSSADAP